MADKRTEKEIIKQIEVLEADLWTLREEQWNDFLSKNKNELVQKIKDALEKYTVNSVEFELMPDPESGTMCFRMLYIKLQGDYEKYGDRLCIRLQRRVSKILKEYHEVYPHAWIVEVNFECENA
jgi:hypothetical protein